MYVIAEVYISPSTNAIIPPFTSKVGKTLLGGVKEGISVSPLKKGGKYLVKYSNLPTFMEVEGGETYSFEVGGKSEDVVKALTDLQERKVFNTSWKVEDVKMREAKVERKDFIEVELLTPALLVDPFRKDKKKRFTNAFFVTFAVNYMDHFKLSREEYARIALSIEEKVREEPSTMEYARVIYAGKEVVGIMGKFRYTILEKDEEIFTVLENALAKGIGSSRKNGFGRVSLK
jgi:CRISPR-associated endoribonuclease Cas6